VANDSKPSAGAIRVRRCRKRKQRGVVAVVPIPVSTVELRLLQQWGYCEDNPSRQQIATALRRFLTDGFRQEYLQRRNGQ